MKLNFGFRGKLWPVRRDDNVVNDDPPGTFWGFWREYKVTFILLFVALLILLRSVISYGQQVVQKPVGVGGQVPDVVVGHVLNYHADAVRVSDFHGKLLILDFWDTWCSACVRELPRLDSLGREFAGKVFILPVTDQKEDMIRRFLGANAYLSGERVVTVTDDKLLGQLFPHNQLPHEVWIGPSGKVLAVTTAEYVTTANISKVLAGGHLDWMQKEDSRPLDLSRPFLASEFLNRLAADAPVDMECLSGYLEGLPLKAGVVRHAATVSYYFINHPPLHLYALALKSPLPFLANRRLLKVEDTLDLVYGVGQGYFNSWQSLHCLSYEATVPARVPEEEVLRQMGAKLDRWLGLEGRIRPVLTDCLVLRAKDSRGSVGHVSYAKWSVKRLDTKGLSYFLNHRPGMPPVIDESGVTSVFSLEAAGIPATVAQWNELLQGVGLELQPDKRVLDMFVLEKPGVTDYSSQIKP